MQFLSYVASFGALQGFLLLLFITLKQRHPGNTPLALFLLVFSLRLATIPTWNYAILINHPWIYPVTSPLPFLFGPLLWWYAWGSIKDKRKNPPMLILHFLPWIAETLAILFSVFIVPAEEFHQLMDSIFTGQPPGWLTTRNSLKLVSNITYLSLTGIIAFGKTSLRLSLYRRTWLRSLTVIPAVVLIFFGYVAIVPEATRQLTGGSATAFMILSTTMTVMIYSVSFLLLIAPERGRRKKEDLECKHNPLYSELECSRLIMKVEDLFSEGAFRDPDLSLTDLAAELKVNSNRLSFAINNSCKSSFRTLLNLRRLDFFIRQVRTGELRKFSILDIAFDAGFPSKSTFNRVFKETYGLTPSEFAENPDLIVESSSSVINSEE